MYSRRIRRVGCVANDKMQGNITVVVDRVVVHPLYKKRVRKTTKYLVHDSKEQARTGDIVEFIDCRPLSKRCRWRLLRVVEKAPESEVIR